MQMRPLTPQMLKTCGPEKPSDLLWPCPSLFLLSDQLEHAHNVHFVKALGNVYYFLILRVVLDRYFGLLVR